MKTSTIYLVTLAVILIVVFLLDTAIAQQSSDNSLRAPFISNIGSKHSIQSIMQNSEKDIVFIENLGQIRDTKGNRRPDILFLTRSNGVDMYITNSGITYVFRKIEGDISDIGRQENRKSSYYRLDMEFAGMNQNISVKKELAVEQKFNYYIPEYPDGLSPKAFKKITIENIYDGIDLVYYEKEGKMKYDFIVKAGADAHRIKMKYKGASSVYIDKDGSVIVTTPMGEIREEKPYTYSRRTGLEIECGFKVNDEVVLFNIPEYSNDDDIVIDPARLWATYYGGSNSDDGRSICTDNSGNIYVTGATYSTNFPIHTLFGAYNQIYNGSDPGLYDAFILKFNNIGAIIWATYYGGSRGDFGSSVIADNYGNIYVTGGTKSTNFPTKTLTGAYNQATLGGSGSDDAFILKFSGSCVRLWATYYGGSSTDVGHSIYTDNSGNIFVTGKTSSTNFPLKRLNGAYNQFSAGGDDVFILKFNSSCARLWATYYGGSGLDDGYSICTDNSGNLYVMGTTQGANFPLQNLPGAYNQTTLYGNFDAFILKFNSSSCARLWATYYGGNGYDGVYSNCTDNSGNLYATGRTFSTNFPLQNLAGAYNQTTIGGGQSDAFILKFNSSNARLWATYYGGDSIEYGNDIYTDTSGKIYVTGRTFSTNFPTKTLLGAYNQTTFGGYSDVFILKFKSSCARRWATYYGGSGGDEGYGICTDNSGNLYITGRTSSINFPSKTFPGAYNQITNAGSWDAFILKFSSMPLPIAPILFLPPDWATLVVTNPLLVWDSTVTAESYRVQLSHDSLFRTTEYDSSNITITEFQVPNNGLNINTLYFWRVNATNAAGTGPYSTIFHFTTGATNIFENNEIPKEFRLYNNYPNPFNPSTKIKFAIPMDGMVSFKVYDITGRLMKTLLNNEFKTADYYTVEFDGSNFASGVYFYQLITEKNIAVKKMVLIK